MQIVSHFYIGHRNHVFRLFSSVIHFHWLKDLSYNRTISIHVCISNREDTIRLCFLQVADVTGS